MGYSINLAAVKSVIPLPLDAVKDNLKLASLVQIKTLIFCFCDTSKEISADAVASGLGIAVSEVEDALAFWVQKGVLLREDKDVSTNTEKTSEKTVANNILPTREDVARRGSEDEKIRLLLREAQICFGRNLKTNESRILVWLCDDKGMDVSVLLLLLHYAAKEDKMRITYIENTAISWIDSGVHTVGDAEKKIAEAAREQICWKSVKSVFGIDRTTPSKKEQELSFKWVDKWKMPKELLRAAYDVCVDNTAKISFPYIDKVLKKWHESGYKTLADIANSEKKKDSGTKMSGYDISAFEKMLNGDE